MFFIIFISDSVKYQPPPPLSHVADVVGHGVGGRPAFHLHVADGRELLQRRAPRVGVSIPRVSAEVKGQLLGKTAFLESFGKVQQVSRLDKV